jgi:homocysteine S-methyltransferase
MTHLHLPQLDRLFLTDAGLESDMIFNRGFDLPCFASIMLLKTAGGRAALDSYFREFVALAKAAGTGLVLETATWRASPDWARPLGLSPAELDQLNREAVTSLLALRDSSPRLPIVVSGCIGPRGDGYDPGLIMTRDEAADYHAHQARTFVDAGVDMLSAMTMTNISEAIGIVRAAEWAGAPVAISFTVETDGRLPTGDTLGEAIAAVDQASGAYPAYFGINCAHPSHFAATLARGGDWVARVKWLRANASRCSHAELDAMTGLDEGNPEELGGEYRELLDRLPHLTVLGGCCGTDIRHIAAIATACAPVAA